MFGRGRGLLNAAQRGSIPWCGRCASGSYHVPEEGVEGDGEDGCNESGVGHVHVAEELRHGCNIHLGGERQLLGSGGACGGTEPHTQRGCLHPKPNTLQERINLSMSPSLNLAKLRVQGQKEGWGLPQNQLPPCLRERRVCSGAQKDPGAVRTCCCEMGTSTTGKPYMYLSHREGGTASRPPCSWGERTDTPSPAPCSLQLVFHYTRPMPTRGTVCTDALASLAAKKLSCLM